MKRLTMLALILVTASAAMGQTVATVGPMWFDTGTCIFPQNAPDDVNITDSGAIVGKAFGLTFSSSAAPIMVFCGDSLTGGYGGTVFWTNNVTLPDGWTRDNAAIGGAQITDMAAHAVSEVDTQYNPASQWNVLWIQGGTNDEDHVSVEVTFARLIAFCRERQKVGWKVIVATLPSRVGSAPSGDTFKNAYNALIRDQWPSFADGIADVGADTHIGEDGDYADLTYFLPDGYHLTDAGYAYFTAAADSAVTSLIAARTNQVETRPKVIRLGGNTSSYADIEVGSAGNLTITTVDGSAAAGNIVMLPDGITIVGNAGNTSNGLSANDDLFVTGKLEVDGTAFFDGSLYTSYIYTTNVTTFGGGASSHATRTLSQQITIVAGASTATTTTLSVPVRSTITGFVAKVTQAPGGGPTNFNVGISSGDADCLIDNKAVTVNGTFDAWEDGDGTYTFFIPVTTTGGAMTFTVTTTDGSDNPVAVTGSSFIIRVVAFYQTRTPPTS